MPRFTSVALPVLMPFFLAGELATIGYLVIKGSRPLAVAQGV